MQVHKHIRTYKRPIITFLVEAGPLMVFFLIDYLYGFFEAVTALVATTFVALVAALFLTRRLPWFAIVSALTVLFFGGFSVYFNNEDIFIFQDTVTNFVLSLILFATAYTRTPILKFFFEGAFAITDRAWRILNLRWGTMFLILGILNEVVRLSFTADVWVHFKAASIVVIVVFGTYQFTLSARERLPDISSPWGLRIK